MGDSNLGCRDVSQERDSALVNGSDALEIVVIPAVDQQCSVESKGSHSAVRKS